MKVNRLTLITGTLALLLTTYAALNLTAPTTKSSTVSTMMTKLKRAFPRYSQVHYDNAQKLLNYAVTHTTDQNQLAYILATAIGESNLVPVKEKRAKEGTPLWRQQNKYWYTGYMGRGYVQLTWKSNYEKFGRLLGIDLVGNPDLALNPTYAGEIIGRGMVGGLFTGVGLKKYIYAGHVDFYNARRIINGLDRAQTFANYAKSIANA